jgi:hypothetical protein
MEQNIWVRRSVIVAIIIVLNLFFNYTVSLVFTEPVMDSYYSRPQVVQNFSTKESCIAVGGQWSEQVVVDTQSSKMTGYCDPDFTARATFEAAKKVYDKKVFATLILLGALCIALGVWLKNSILKFASMWGGVVSLLIASMRYWSSAGAFLKVVVLAIALAGLVTLAVKKFSSEEGN